jgi:hypothetical protein
LAFTICLTMANRSKVLREAVNASDRYHIGSGEASSSLRSSCRSLCASDTFSP